MLVCISVRNYAQDSITTHVLLKRIAAQQIQYDDFFLQGIFPSYISQNQKFSTRKKDNNIFFNALIIYTLQQLKQYLDTADKKIADSIIQRSEPLFEKFRNRNGRDTYNFWRTDSAYDYPYAGILRLFAKNITLPDDMDDTVLSLLALDVDDSTARAVHALMQNFVNSDSNKVRTVIKAYDNLPAYSTWFGKKFPVVFDVSVLCNILSFVEHYKLELTKADSAGLSVIQSTIINNEHINRPEYASPYYPKTSLILYHVSRLMNNNSIPVLDSIRLKIITDAAKQLAQSKNILEKILLSSTILKLGYQPPEITPENLNEIETNDFCFFVGNVPSYFQNTFRKLATEKNFLLFYHYCPAFNDILLLENMLLNNR